jgi:NTP pyrophosphatase (non-canonical NTP hydrolase)
MITINVGTSMSGFHRWPGAPSHRAYLGLRHQHTFWFEVRIPVDKADRDLEFHDMRERLELILLTMFPKGEFGDKSCEQIAIDILKRMPEAVAAIVGEDPQHYAWVNRDDTAMKPSGEGLHLTTICGSTKFKEETLRAIAELEDEGIATMAVGSFMHADSVPISPETKARYDVLHKDKIRRSNSIYVVNPDGYIGSSTAEEIILAWSLGLPVRYRYPRYAVSPEPLNAFHDRMARKLLKNASKGGWESETITDLIAGIRRETGELDRAFTSGESYERVADEAADVANYCMMVADRLTGRQKIE